MGRDSSEVLPDGGTENTKAVCVPTCADIFSPISGGTGCTGPYFLFRGISACAIDGKTKCLATGSPFDPEIRGVIFSACGDSSRRSTELNGGVEFLLTISNDFVVGFTAVGISGCSKKDFYRE